MGRVEQDLIDFPIPPKVQDFINYHHGNFEVYTLFRNYMLAIIGKVKKGQPISPRTIIERVRYKLMLRDGQSKKLNNNYVAGYMRLFIAEFPHHQKLFEVRGSIFDNYFHYKNEINKWKMRPL